MAQDKIAIVPFGKIEEKVLEYLKQGLEEAFQKEVYIGENMDIPKNSYNNSRRQYLSTDFLKALIKSKAAKNDIQLGIVDVDLYVPELNFVFGEASLTEGAAIISVARLRQEFYDLPADDKIFLERSLKEAVHELGHVYGLRHCSDPTCVMFFSNSLGDTDGKSYNFCPKCRKLLEK